MAGGYHGTLTQTSSEHWHRSFAVNLDSMFYVLHAAIPGLIRQGGGSIVNMASMASSVRISVSGRLQRIQGSCYRTDKICSGGLYGRWN